MAKFRQENCGIPPKSPTRDSELTDHVRTCISALNEARILGTYNYILGKWEIHSIIKRIDPDVYFFAR